MRMLNLEPWRRYPLSVQVLSTEFSHMLAGATSLRAFTPASQLHASCIAVNATVSCAAPHRQAYYSTSCLFARSFQAVFLADDQSAGSRRIHSCSNVRTCQSQPPCAGTATPPHHMQVVCAPAADLPLDVVRNKVIADGKAKWEEKFLLLPRTVGQSLDIAAGPGSAASQQAACGSTASLASAPCSQSTSAALSDSAGGDDAIDSDSASSGQSESAAVDGAAPPQDGAALVSPGDCKDCGQKCTKNWFKCAYSSLHALLGLLGALEQSDSSLGLDWLAVPHHCVVGTPLTRRQA